MKWQIQKEFDNEPAYIMDADNQENVIAELPPRSHYAAGSFDPVFLIAAAPEMLAALKEARVAIATLVCELDDLKEAIGPDPESAAFDAASDAANAKTFALIDAVIALAGSGAKN